MRRLAISVARAGHVDRLLGAAPAALDSAAAGEVRRALSGVGVPQVYGFAAIDRESGVVVALMGITVHQGRGDAWAILGRVPRRLWPEIVAEAAAVLDELQAGGIRRVEAQVRAGFAPGRLLAERLGFVAEGIMPAWCDDGTAAIRYGRVRSVIAEREAA